MVFSAEFSQNSNI